MQLDRVGLSSNLLLDHAGEVVLTLDSSALSWKSVKGIENELDASSCLGFVSKFGNWIEFSDVYSVEFINWGLIHEPILPNTGGCFLGHDLEMYRFVVHGCQKSKMRRNTWVLAAYTFGHKDLKTCQMWVEKINAHINNQAGRPKSLLVFVHPRSGKGNGHRIWETVAPIFSRAKVRTKVIVTQRAGHAFDVMKSITDKELNSYDGVIAVGGDGFFNEVLNGLLSSRHEAHYPPAPTEFMQSVGFESYHCTQRTFHTEGGSVHTPNDAASDIPHHNEASDPLLENSESILSDLSNSKTEIGPCDTDESPVLSFPNEQLRLGIIPAGSTDAIVISTTGARDPVTSAVHIVLGKRRCLDIAQVVRWKGTISSTDPPMVRYAASFAGYGFYGDVITESEKYRWMGPTRYDFAGTKVFMKHKSYEAEVAFLEVKSDDPIIKQGFQDTRTRQIWNVPENPKKLACRVNCPVCEEAVRPAGALANAAAAAESQGHLEDSKWRRLKGCFLSIGAAIISCRNERAPDGLVADAHLSDGLMHLILVKDCPRAFYLWHLTQLTRRGSNPLDFEFVEHHKTTAFTFTSSSDESVWNLDGELLQARQLSAQVFRGLVSLFASGPEV